MSIDTEDKAIPAGKRCNGCRRTKPRAEFSKDRSKVDGLRTTCRSCKKKSDAAWHLANRKNHCATMRARYRANPAEYHARAKRWGVANPVRLRAAKLKWASEHRDIMRRCISQWAKKYPHKKCLKEQRRRAIKLAVDDGTITIQAWEKKLAKFDHRCWYCGKKSTRLHIEHMTPLCRGGKHTLSNVIPACPKCNNQKGMMTAEEFVPIGER